VRGFRRHRLGKKAGLGSGRGHRESIAARASRTSLGAVQ
jgi:hypothetical protein